MIKTINGCVPANEEEAEKLKAYKLGATIRFQSSEMRNGKFFGKWWALAKVAFDYWTETAKPPEYHGQPVQPNFKKFRKDLTILAGHYHMVTTIKGEVRAEADSLAWGKMDEDTFEKFYSDTIEAVLKNIYGNKAMTEEQLRAWVDEVMPFV